MMVIMQERVSAQMTTMGTDFWMTSIIMTQMGQVDHSVTGNWIRILISSPRSCTATLHDPFNHWDTTFFITAGEVTTWTDNVSRDSRPITSNTTHNIGLHLTATDSVTVIIYMMANSTESSVLLPTHALGSDYIVQTYSSCQNTAHMSPPSSNFVVLATEDSTWVDIDLGGATSVGDSAGDHLNVLLPSAGMVYQVTSPPDGDLSGTRVTALGGKKIAVFEGVDCAVVPNGYTNVDNFHFEQAIPTGFWGRHFFAYSKPNLPHRVRITSLNDQCIVYVNSQYRTTLEGRETYEYEIPDSVDFDYIVTSQPACVGVYSPRRIIEMNQYMSNMLIMPPWEQASEANVFPLSYSVSGYDFSQELHVIMKSDETAMFRLDSNIFSQYFHPIAANPFFSYAVFQLSNAGHSLYTTGGEGYVAWVVNQLRAGISGTHSVGAGLRDMQNSLNINETANANWLDTVVVCTGDSVHFWIESLYEPDSVRWQLGDGTTFLSDGFWRIFNQQGQYSVKAIVYAACVGCYRQIDTLNATVRIFGHDTMYVDTMGCDHVFEWRDSLYTIPSTIEYSYLDGNRCKSTIYLNVENRDHTSAVTEMVTGCDSLLFGEQWYTQRDTVFLETVTNGVGCDSIKYVDLVIFHSSQGFAEPIDYCDSMFFQGQWCYGRDTMTLETMTNADGCDSVVFVTLMPHPSYDRTISVDLCQGDSLAWIDGNIYYSTDSVPPIILQSQYGCDSIMRLVLHIIPPPPSPVVDSSVIWVPNAFTPDEETNNRFQVFSNDIVEIKVTVFDRRGLRICYFNGISGFWDGTYGVTSCPEGTYVYIIQYRTIAAPEYWQQKIGTVLLLR